MIVLVDVDGVLRDLMGKLVEVYEREFPSHQVEPITEWGFDKFFPIGKGINDFLWSWHPAEIFGEAPAFPGASIFLRSLRIMGHHVRITTSQGDPHTVELTAAWLRANGMQFDSLFFTKDKGEVPGDVLLDDGVHNLVAFANTGRAAFAFNQPWNQDWLGGRVRTYDEFLRIMQGAQHEADKARYKGEAGK